MKLCILLWTVGLAAIVIGSIACFRRADRNKPTDAALAVTAGGVLLASMAFGLTVLFIA